MLQKILLILIHIFLILTGKVICEEHMYSNFIPKLNSEILISKTNKEDNSAKNDMPSIIVRNDQLSKINTIVNKSYLERFSAQDISQIGDSNHNLNSGFSTTLTTNGVQPLCIIQYSQNSIYIDGEKIKKIMNLSPEKIPLFRAAIAHEKGHCAIPRWIISKATEKLDIDFNQLSEVIADIYSLKSEIDDDAKYKLIDFRKKTELVSLKSYTYERNLESINKIDLKESVNSYDNPALFTGSVVTMLAN